MCLRPIKIKNKSKKLDIYNGDSLYIEVPCGQCSECKTRKASDYLVRCYYEYIDTIEKGGYVFFETLTYSNKYVPRFKFNGKEYLCFSRSHFRHFFVRLRRYLDYYGFDVKNNLKYFFVCEYGGKTHRPHYHFLCFMKNGQVTPYVLKEYIRKAWKFGITDTRSVDKGIVNGLGALQYVAKYVNKDDDFVKLLGEDIDKMKKWISLHSGKKMKERLIEKIKDIVPFHRQSKGFGLSLKDSLTEKELLDGTCNIPDRKMINKNVAIPDYITRKIFYDCDYDSEGRLHWILNDKGIERKILRLDENIELLASRYRDIYNHYRNYDISLDDENAFNKVTLKYFKENLDRYLDGRSWFDFALYCYVYKGKMVDKNDKLKLELEDYHDFYKQSLYKNKHVLFDSHIGKDNDNYRWKKRHIVKYDDSLGYYVFVKDDKGKYVNESVKYGCDYVVNKQLKEEYTVSDLEDKFVINEDSCYKFRNFDKLYDLIKMYSYRGYSIYKQAAYDMKQEMKSMMKMLNSNYSYKVV